jgi:hypothetical protein
MKCGAFMIAIAMGNAPAQSLPDFTGEWTRVDTAAERGSVAAVGDAQFRVGNLGSGWGATLILRQEAGRLVVQYTFFSTYDLQAPIRLTYALDGSESRNTLNIGHTESILRSRAEWRDTSLVITTSYGVPHGVGTTEVRQALTLASPTSLIIETTRTGVPGTSPTVVRTAYLKR